MGTGFLAGDFDVPPPDEPGEYLERAHLDLGTEKRGHLDLLSARTWAVFFVPYQHPAQAHGITAGGIPQRDATDPCHSFALVAIPGDARRMPDRVRVSQPLPERGLAGTLLWLGPPLAPRLRGGQIIESCIHAQASDLGHLPTLAGGHEVDRGVRTVSYQHALTVRLPSAYL